MSYEQTYRQKKVIKLAPDMVIHVERKPDIEICPNCNATLNISNYIMDVTTSLPLNGSVGTAAFTLAFPRHGHNGQYITRGGRIFGIYLMNEIEIFFKARFKDSNGNFQYIRSFWGVITNITESYGGGGQQLINVTCESMLKWMQMMSTNVHPAVTSLETVYQGSDNIGANLAVGSSFALMNVYQIIHTVVSISFRNMIIPSVLDTEKNPEAVKEAFGFDSKAVKEKQLITAWQKKFATIKSSLRMFGTTPESFIKQTDKVKAGAENTVFDQKIAPFRRAITPFEIRYNASALMDFKPFTRFSDNTDLHLITQTYKNNLEIVNEIKLTTGFEFYLDTVGEIIFKPPFWNMKTKDNPVYVIEDDDIINWNFSESEAEVITRVEVTGQLLPIYPQNAELNPRGIFTDYNLARQFGIKSYPLSMDYYNSARLCYYHAISEIDRINANRFRGSLTIVGRPELRLGFPVYIASRDCYVYIENITHSFVFGGPFTTQIEFSSMRRKYVGQDEKEAEILPIKGYKAGGFKGFSSTLLFEGASTSLNDIEKQLKKPAQEKLDQSSNKIEDKEKRYLEDYQKDSTSFLKSNREGKYIEVSSKHKDVVKAYELMDKAKKQGDSASYLKILELMIPISDEEGFELIGAYEYGRTTYLNSSNVIKKKGNSFSDIAKTADKVELKTVSIVAESPENIVKQVGEPRLNPHDANELKNALENFLAQKSTNLARLDPRKQVDIKKCTCTSVNLQAAVVQPKFPKKIIKNLPRREK